MAFNPVGTGEPCHICGKPSRFQRCRKCGKPVCGACVNKDYFAASAVAGQCKTCLEEEAEG
jgi:hypothetical protein